MNHIILFVIALIISFVIMWATKSPAQTDNKFKNKRKWYRRHRSGDTSILTDKIGIEQYCKCGMLAKFITNNGRKHEVAMCEECLEKDSVGLDLRQRLESRGTAYP